MSCIHLVQCSLDPDRPLERFPEEAGLEKMPGFSVEGHVLVELLMCEERHDGGVVGVEPGPLGSCPGTTFSRYLGVVWPAWCSYRLPCVADPVTGETDPRIVILVVEDDV